MFIGATILDHPRPAIMPLVVRDLHKRYGRRVYAVRGVSFTLEEGSVMGLVGPNGAGKTTTIKCILGLVRPTRGEILVDGEPSTAPSARVKLGYVPELPDAPQWMTPLELLEMLGRLEGLSAVEARRRAVELLREVGLSEAASRKIGALSKGMRKRLLIAQALLNTSSKRYILMDEPMSGLDPEWVEWVRSVVRRLRGEGVAVLISSHLLRELEGLVDTVTVIYAGRVVYQGGLSELMEAAGGPVVEARVSDPEKVRALLESHNLVARVEVEGDTVRAYLKRGADPFEVVEAIRSSGVRVLSVEAKSFSLEELYRRLVGGEGGAR